MIVLSPYSVVVEDLEVEGFLQQFAPIDVQDTIAWLSVNGYTLAFHRGKGTFGAQFVYRRDAEVLITVDRSQWTIDVAPRFGDVAWQYDLLFAAHSGKPYGQALPTVGTTPIGSPLPEQLPQGVSWCETLPTILQWVTGDDVPAAVDQARCERHRVMWPPERQR